MGKEITRREFVKTGSVGLAATGGLLMSTSAKSYGRILGANDKINMAVIGLKGRGIAHVLSFGKMKNVSVKYLVDVDENQFKRRIENVEEVSGETPKTEWDMRRVFDDKVIDGHSVNLSAKASKSRSHCSVTSVCQFVS